MKEIVILLVTFLGICKGFTQNPSGSVMPDSIKTVVKKGIGFGCDEEAARVVSLMQFESLRYRGLRVVFHKTINIHFHIPGAQVLNTEVTYTYVENKPKENSGTYIYKPGE